LGRGFEPDNCYYVRHAAAVRAKKELDLAEDPPPELAIEIDLIRRRSAKLGICGAFGVPEVWRYDAPSLTVYHLGPDGEYQSDRASAVFPRFPVAEVERLLQRADSAAETQLVKSLRQWIRENVLPGEH
jgi:Uma2 family endonuclease